MLAVWTVIGSAPELRAAPELVNGIQAVVHEAVVTLSDVQIMTAPAEQVLYRQYPSPSEIFFKKLAAAQNDSLDQLIERQLILHDFKVEFGQPERQAIIDKEINKEVDQELDAEIRARTGGNRMTFIQTMQAEGITLERHRQIIRDRIIIGWLRQKNISSELIVSPHRVEVYYLAHREEFKVQEQVKLRMIVLRCPGDADVAKTEKLAEDILRALKEGATFAEMATIHSEGSQRSQGGDLGWWEMPSTNKSSASPSQELTKYLADTAASLQAGQHSGVMSRSVGDDFWVCEYSNSVPILGRHYVADTTLKKEVMAEERRFDDAAASTNQPPPMEFYLMLVEDKRPERFKTLTDVRAQIEKDLKTQEQKRLEKQWVDKLKKKTFVRVF
jgi:parvulin-like peptidyl-prolyl isomerase